MWNQKITPHQLLARHTEAKIKWKSYIFIVPGSFAIQDYLYEHVPISFCKMRLCASYWHGWAPPNFPLHTSMRYKVLLLQTLSPLLVPQPDKKFVEEQKIWDLKKDSRSHLFHLIIKVFSENKTRSSTAPGAEQRFGACSALEPLCYQQVLSAKRATPSPKLNNNKRKNCTSYHEAPCLVETSCCNRITNNSNQDKNTSLPAKSSLHLHMVKQKLESKDHAALLSCPRKASSYHSDAGQKKTSRPIWHECSLKANAYKSHHHLLQHSVIALDVRTETKPPFPFKRESSLFPLGASLSG